MPRAATNGVPSSSPWLRSAVRRIAAWPVEPDGRHPLPNFSLARSSTAWGIRVSKSWILTRSIGPIVQSTLDSAAALELCARSLFHSAQLGRAEQAFRRLVEQRPDDGWARMGLARALERQGKGEVAAVRRRIAEALGQGE